MDEMALLIKKISLQIVVMTMGSSCCMVIGIAASVYLPLELQSIHLPRGAGLGTNGMGTAQWSCATSSQVIEAVMEHTWWGNSHLLHYIFQQDLEGLGS